MDKEQYRLHRLKAVLRAQGLNSLSDVAARFDKGADYTAIKGVGDVLAGVLRGLMRAYYDGLQ